MRFPLGLMIFALAAIGGCSDDTTNKQDGSIDLAAGGDLQLVAHDLANPITCVTDLSNLGTGDFQIAFTLRTTQIGKFAIANQRAACAPGNFWDLRMEAGHVLFETDGGTDGGTDDTVLTGCAALNTGQLHDIVIQRVGGVVADYIDGNIDAAPAPSLTSFGALAPLATANDACDAVDGTSRFDATIGTISNFCVSRTIVPQPHADGGVCP